MTKKEQKFKDHYKIKTMHEDLDKLSPPPSELPKVPSVEISSPLKPELLKPPKPKEEFKKNNKKQL